MPAVDLIRSKTFKRFKADLIAQIPRVPNDKTSLVALESKSPTELLIIYLCWRLRFIEIRPRAIKGKHRLWYRLRYLGIRSNVNGLLSAAEMGRDLNPYLSLRAHRHGFVLDGSEDSVQWKHKDFLLNVMGLHHFHLGIRLEAKGHMARTDTVLFAFVDRDTFEILGLFNHGVFKNEDKVLPLERRKIWSTFERFQSRRTPPGSFYVGGYGGMGITLAGTPTAVTLRAIDHIRLIEEFDPQLDSPDFLAKLWGAGQVPARHRVCWHYKHLTLGLLDTVSNTFFALTPG